MNPPTPQKLLPLNPPSPPPPRNFQLSYVAGVWIFSGTTHSSKNPHKRQYQEKKTIPANMYNHFHIKLASYWTRTGSTCTCILCYFSSYWMWDEKNTGKKCQSNMKSSSHPSLELAPVQVFPHPQSGLTRKGCCFNTESSHTWYNLLPKGYIVFLSKNNWLYHALLILLQ